MPKIDFAEEDYDATGDEPIEVQPGKEDAHLQHLFTIEEAHLSLTTLLLSFQEDVWSFLFSTVEKMRADEKWEALFRHFRSEGLKHFFALDLCDENGRWRTSTSTNHVVAPRTWFSRISRKEDSAIRKRLHAMSDAVFLFRLELCQLEDVRFLWKPFFMVLSTESDAIWLETFLSIGEVRKHRSLRVDNTPFMSS